VQSRSGSRRGERSLRIDLGTNGLDLGSEFQLLAAFSRAANQKVAQARWLGDLRDLFNRSTEHRRAENLDYLLLHNELLNLFRDFRVLDYREGRFLQSGEGAFRAGLLVSKES
jgi:hypothetical protein